MTTNGTGDCKHENTRWTVAVNTDEGGFAFAILGYECADCGTRVSWPEIQQSAHRLLSLAAQEAEDE